MAVELQENLDTLDGVDEGIAKLYTESEGKFVLDLGNLQNTTKVDAILEKERGFTTEAERKLKDMEAKYKDVDLDAIEAMRLKTAQLEADRVKAEEEKLLADHDFEQVLANRIEKRDADWQMKFDVKDGTIAEKQSVIDALKRSSLEGILSGQLSGVKGMHDGGRRDALEAAMRKYTLDDSGNAVLLDSSGDVVIGKDGKSAFSLNEDANSSEYRKVNNHWFLATGKGGGMIQGDGGHTIASDLSGLSRVQRIERQLEINQKNR